MIQVYTLTVSDFSQNCRVLLDEESRELMIIDPGAEAQRIFSLIQSLNSKMGLEKVTIVLTHLHIDHVGAVKPLQALVLEQLKMEAPLYYHKEAAQFANTIRMQAHVFGLNLNDYEDVPEADKYIDEKSELSLGENSIQVLYTPGHAIGHVSLFFNVESFKEDKVYNVPFVVSGDALFYGSIGRTDLPGGNHQELLESIRTKLFFLPPDTIVMSGHGPNTTVGHEMETNYFLK